MRAIIHDGPWTYEVVTGGDNWEKFGEGEDDWEEVFTFHVATITSENRTVFWQPCYGEDGKARTYESEQEALKAGIAHLCDHLSDIKHTI